MRRLLILALLALSAFAVPAVAQTTDTTGTASCVDGDDDAALTAAASTDDGGVPAGPTDVDGGSSGGTPATWDDGTPVEATGTGDAMSGGSQAPVAVAAQDPEPEPEGPGEEQPGAPGGEPQEPETPGVPDVPSEAPGAETGGGGLPVTGIEAFQLALLGLVLLLVGARLRVIALRRRNRPPATEPPEAAWEEHPEPEYEEAPTTPVVAHGYVERDEWSFPDPSEPAPTGLLPSTASARRRARALAMAGDRD